jgi:hypothetical protein
MRWVAAIFAAWASLPAADLTSNVERIAEVQGRLPWFWTAAMTGMADIPYAYQITYTRQIRDATGRIVKPKRGGPAQTEWRLIRYELIPIEAQVSTCGTGDYPDANAVRAARRERERQDWADFAASYRFEPGPRPGLIRFASDEKAGELEFDTATHEVTRMAYRTSGGERFSIALSRSLDGGYLPSRVHTRVRIGPRNIEERTVSYSGYRRAGK